MIIDVSKIEVIVSSLVSYVSALLEITKSMEEGRVAKKIASQHHHQVYHHGARSHKCFNNPIQSQIGVRDKVGPLHRIHTMINIKKQIHIKTKKPPQTLHKISNYQLDLLHGHPHQIWGKLMTTLRLIYLLSTLPCLEKG